MKELIKITEQNGKKVVSARELHKFLEVTERFNSWCNRMFEYGFIESVDYQGRKVFNTLANQYLIDYALTLNTSKEIAMLQRSEKGKQARQYFIKCEELAKQQQRPALDFDNPDAVLQLAHNWADEKKKRILAEKEADRLRPKAELMDKVIATDEMIDIGQVAKVLKLPFGRNTLFKKLREKGIFFKNRNEPKQEYVNRKYFDLKEKFIERNNHDGFMVMKVLVTQKGLAFIASLFGVVENKPAVAKIA